MVNCVALSRVVQFQNYQNKNVKNTAIKANVTQCMSVYSVVGRALFYKNSFYMYLIQLF